MKVYRTVLNFLNLNNEMKKDIQTKSNSYPNLRVLKNIFIITLNKGFKYIDYLNKIMNYINEYQNYKFFPVYFY